MFTPGVFSGKDPLRRDLRGPGQVLPSLGVLDGRRRPFRVSNFFKVPRSLRHNGPLITEPETCILYDQVWDQVTERHTGTRLRSSSDTESKRETSYTYYYSRQGVPDDTSDLFYQRSWIGT